MPLVRYAEEWWMVSHGLGHVDQCVHEGVLPVSTLGRVLNSALACHLQWHQKMALQKQKGPVSDAVLWLLEAGCGIKSPARFIDRRGVEVCLTAHSPVY
eukprot:3996696-Pyramimonas_sp.AAC.1